MAKPTPSSPSDSRDESTKNETPSNELARSYIRVQPTDNALDPETVYNQFCRLQQITQSDPTSLLNRLQGPTRPTLESLLVSDTETESSLTYYVGIDDADAIDELHRILRGVFPNSYEFDRVEWHTDCLTTLEDTTSKDDSEATNIAGVEFQGRADRRRDWQTQLTPFEEFTSHDEDDHARIPLTAIVETMAERELPMVYQALLRPKPDWTDDLEDRRIDIEMNIDTLGGQLANAVFGTPDETDPALSASDEERLAELEGKDARRSFEVNARAVS